MEVYKCIKMYSLIWVQICSQAKILPRSTLGVKNQSNSLHLSFKYDPNNLIKKYYWVKQEVIIKMQHASMDTWVNYISKKSDYTSKEKESKEKIDQLLLMLKC